MVKNMKRTKKKLEQPLLSQEENPLSLHSWPKTSSSENKKILTSKFVCKIQDYSAKSS